MRPSSVFRVGFIGFGSIAENGHVPAWQSFSGVEVTAVSDLSSERLDAARACLPDAELYDSPSDLIRRADVDILDICTPPGTHAELIVEACARGFPHIVSEKPLVLGEDELLRVVRAKTATGGRIICVDNWRHSDLNRHVRSVLREGVIGPVESVVLRTGRPDIALGNAGWMPRWRTDLKHAGGGIILDHGWHQLYLLLDWIRAPIESVSALTRTVDERHYPVEDDARVRLCFPAAEGTLELSWHEGGRSNDGEIRGRDGRIDVHDDRIDVHMCNAVQTHTFHGRLTESSYHPDWFRAIFGYHVLDGSRERADRNFAEAAVLVSIIATAYRSAAEDGRPLRPRFATFDEVVCALTEVELTQARGGRENQSPRWST